MQHKVIPADWQAAIETVVAAQGLVVLIGAKDTGKTTFCTALANAALERGVRVAVVDADVGQSEIGPPTTIGMGVPEGFINSLHEIPRRAFYFVGSTAPAGHLLEMVNGTRQMVDRASQEGADLVVVDTTGFVVGSTARKLKAYKMEMIAPRHLIFIERNDEAGPLEALFRGDTRYHLYRLKAPIEAVPKPREMRAVRRTARFFEHFQRSTIHTFPMENLAFWGTYLGSGEPLEWPHLRFASESLKVTVYHGEKAGEWLYLITGGPCHPRGVALVEEHFAIRRLVLALAERFVNLVVGLVDGEGRLLNIGLIKNLDFKKRMISIFTPLRSPDRVRQVRFGTLRVRENGVEIGHLRPGEI